MYLHLVLFPLFVSLFSPCTRAHELIVYYDLRPPLITINPATIF